MALRLPRNKVACIPIFDPSMSDSGLLHIPDMAKQRVDHGVVKYMAAEMNDIKIGDIVLFSGYTGTLMALNSEIVIVVPIDFITSVLHPDSIPVPGLFHMDEDGELFEATYESSLELIARAYEESEWNRKLKVNVISPKKGEVTWR